MNGKLFISTFALIFLAELGDKTQLAAMARTATAGSRWTVFAAASLALVFSTLIAVLVGGGLSRLVPPHVIKLAAGLLFIVFGALILRSALVARAPAAPAAAAEGPLGRIVLRLAAEFEEAAAANYAALAAESADPRLAALLRTLEAEERQHLDRVRGAHTDFGAATLPEAAQVMPAAPAPALVGAAPDAHVLARAIEHERATARFYEELAGLTPLPALQRAFETLAAEEHGHAARLEAFTRSAVT